jgi:hypothetical protein
MIIFKDSSSTVYLAPSGISSSTYAELIKRKVLLVGFYSVDFFYLKTK